MSRGGQRARQGFGIGVPIWCVLGLLCCQGLNEQELQCEEIVQHITHCCPRFEPRSINCDYVRSCSGGHDPDLGGYETMREKSCDALEREGLCDITTLVATGPSRGPQPGGPSADGGRD